MDVSAPEERRCSGGPLAGTPILLNGIMYITSPDKVWALDTRTGRQLWAYIWTSKGGIHLGDRGVRVFGNSLYFETPDCNLVSLELADDEKRWNQPICDLDQMYYASVAPVVIKNRIITGVSGDDLDRPGFLEAHDPETGALQWHWSVAPEPGEARPETWPNAEAMAPGGGMTWISPTYDPDLNLLYIGTGNPQPVMAGKTRWAQPVYRIDRGLECGYGQTGLVFSAFSAGPARLGCGKPRYV